MLHNGNKKREREYLNKTGLLFFGILIEFW